VLLVLLLDFRADPVLDGDGRSTNLMEPITPVCITDPSVMNRIVIMLDVDVHE